MATVLPGPPTPAKSFILEKGISANQTSPRSGSVIEYWVSQSNFAAMRFHGMLASQTPLSPSNLRRLN
jgi:hypothetical protein